MNRFARRCCAVVSMQACLAASAQTLPPADPFDAMAWKPTLRKPPFTRLQMGRLHVDAETTPLHEVRRAAGAGRIAHRGDAGDSAYWLCYTATRSIPAQRVWLVSSEMGSPEHRVTGIGAEVVPDGHPTADCPALPPSLQPLALDDGVWLGTSPEDTATHIGTPSFRKGAWSSYDFAGKAAGHCGREGFDVTASLKLRFKDGRADALQGYRVTSC